MAGGDTVMTEDLLMTTLRATFRPDAAHAVQACFEVRAADVVVHAVVDRGRVGVYPGPTSDADVVIDAGPMLESLLAGEIGAVSIIGAPDLLTLFVTLFQRPGLPGAMAA